MEVELVKRIAASGLRLAAGIGTLKADDKPQVVARIGAQVDKCNVRPNANGGESTQLCGDFLAILPNGKALKSRTMYLPEYFSSQVAKAIEESGAGVKFGCTLMIQYSKSVIGYEYTVKPKDKIQLVTSDMEKLLPPPGKD